MAVPSRMHKAGAREIRNRESLESQKKNSKIKKEKLTPEEHEERIKLLKSMGLLK